ncbi:hypothetical protein DPEC_G00156740 [Dallia pectoralis]|uniref:Uncharacterized protein n=1 Tax=Dallia pectoralis TaxID=75939 RepID=A0ACC2GLA9_DALPE|nr:hypothetical protein DPEC_G00156740 [Dallia pectoralis]
MVNDDSILELIDIVDIDDLPREINSNSAMSSTTITVPAIPSATSSSITVPEFSPAPSLTYSTSNASPISSTPDREDIEEPFNIVDTLKTLKFDMMLPQPIKLMSFVTKNLIAL